MANQITCHYRSDTLSSCRRALGDGTLYFNGSNDGTITADATAIGGFYLNVDGSGGYRSARIDGVLNTSDTLTHSFLVRIKPQVVGNQEIIEIAQNRFANKTKIWFSVGKAANAVVVSDGGGTLLNSALGTFSYTAGASAPWIDVVVTCEGSTAANGYKFYVDSSLVAQATFSAPMTSGQWTSSKLSQILFATGSDTGAGRYYLNEFCKWNYIIDPTNITLVDPTTGITSTGQALNGSSRTGWIDSAAFIGKQWTSISAAQIKSGVTQIQAGLTQTGSYTGLTDFWTSLAASDIRNSVSQLQNGSTITGTFAGETWTTIGASDIREGVNQIQNSTTITGTLVVPTAVTGTASTVNIGNIKEQLRYVLAQNNTTTGYEIVDLSANMTNRVVEVFKYNPEKIPLSAHMLPAVYIFTDQKTIEPKTIAVDQASGKRQADVQFTIAGAVWNPLINANFRVDPADEDIEKLMENIERIIRSYGTLSGNVRWQFPEAVTYHSIPIDEQSHLRVSYMRLSCKVFY